VSRLQPNPTLALALGALVTTLNAGPLRAQEPPSLGSWEAAHAEELAAFAKTRAKARALERAGKPWRELWEATAERRKKLEASLHAALLPCLAAATEATPPRAAHLASTTQTALTAGRPQAIRAAIETTGAAALLGTLATHHRRALLHAVLERAAALPGTTDLDVLVEVVEWDTLLLRELESDAAVDQLSRDMVVLFTERAEDGMTRGDAGYYRGGRLRDTGFASRLRDDSDQVRHFAWAFRMFAISPDADSVLHMKEVGDALRRGKPINEVDLVLNATAGRVVARLRGTAQPHLALSDLPRHLRAVLGGR